MTSKSFVTSHSDYSRAGKNIARLFECFNTYNPYILYLYDTIKMKLVLTEKYSNWEINKS